MPRIPPWLLTQAASIDPNLARLLPVCRGLASARNELRWLTEHVSGDVPPSARLTARQRAKLKQLCTRRRTGEPLQYILGTQPFGKLDIRCRAGVLVPRSETEAYTLHLADILRHRQGEEGMRIIDFCTGTGCIPLLLYSKLQNCRGQPVTEVRGVDISPEAVDLSHENLRYSISTGKIQPPSAQCRMSFVQADVFDDTAIAEVSRGGPWDVLVSNPPYVSREAWTEGNRGLSMSARKFEPKLALVPQDEVPRSEHCQHEDAFYERLLTVARALRSRVILLELGDAEQARRVLTLIHRSGLLRDASRVEVWRDWPDMQRQEDEDDMLNAQKSNGENWRVKVRGSGNIRCIFMITSL
ncbi:hypothetical protein Cpir12675_004148 [Ceratocystis pirilliformis]|uniref:Release factor glutamine methyltransferase N-terminal domain-containing protein n=1 Tax=Ceratocystis pirilliformis TaxID=259994 RepID=A0ABR3YYE2_9PEZI